MIEPQGLGRLKANGHLLDVFERDGHIVVRLKCACGKEFERDLHGSGLSARVQEHVYCGRGCARKGNQFMVNNSSSQARRFKYYKEQML